jgi:phytanoyl-CoA hydroxylase
MADWTITRRYRTDGYVAVPGLFSRERVAEIAAQIDRAGNSAAERMAQGDFVLEQSGGGVRNLWRLEHYDEFFADLGNDPAVVGVVEKLIGAPVDLVAVETFNKPARHGSAVPPHQDNACFCQEPPDMLTVWVAIDATTSDNGPVHYAAGTTEVLLPHKGSGIPGSSMVLIDPPTYPAEQVHVGLLEPGDAMVHHCLTVHWSEPNRSDRSRCGLLLVYRAKHTRTSKELRDIYTEAQALLKSSN